MSQRSEQRSIAIVSACMTGQGTPELVLTTVEVTQDEIENGIHYYVAEGELLERGYEEPMVHFDETESPPFLHSTVRQYLALTPHHSINHSSEKHACHA